MTDSEAFARPDMAEGTLWIETPQTEQAMKSLFRLLDVARLDDPGWQPIWVLCGPEGAGKSALARRFAAQAARSSACDAMKAAEDRVAESQKQPRRFPSPAAFAAPKAAWARHMNYETMKLDERVRRFGHCPHHCRPAQFLHGTTFREMLEYGEELGRIARPVGTGELRPRSKDPDDTLAQWDWLSPGNRNGDRLTRTSLFFVDEADHLIRLSANKRGDMLEQMRDWPRNAQIEHSVTFVLIGTPALSEAVAACGEVRRIDVPPMALDGIDGTFGQVCRLIFGTQDPGEIERLHGASRGAMGPLLTLARLQGLEPPFNIPEIDILHLPAPDQD